MSMVLPPPQTREFVDRLTSLAAECRDELEQSSQSLQEIDLLLNQTQSEVDRLSQRESQQNARIREMEASLEAYSRADIRSTYLAAHDVSLRLFMMRSQLEALESRRESIDTQQQKLRILLNLAEINREQSSDSVATNSRTTTLQGNTSLFGESAIDLAPELIQARERERLRIARQLTDGPAQVLANLILRTEIVKRAAERAPESVVEEVDDLREMAASSLLNVRRSIFEMRPLVLDELGLVPTLRRYSADFGRENGASITINGPDRDDSIAGHTRVALFRLIQQALLALVTPNTGTNVQCDIRFEEAQLAVRMDASSIGPKTVNTVAHFVEDAYTLDAIDLIGGSIQHEQLPTGVRVTMIVPIGLN
ncbi:MAG TPA: histidine kinase [Thermomicrobiales bacterium]|nr:histidine kinase [Thermomicrobiales bacterium]